MTDPIRPPHAGTVPSNDFARALDEAMSARDLTLERIQARLASAGTPVSVATLSYWRTGRSLPRRRASLRAVQQLEQIIGLPNGELQRLLPVAGAGVGSLPLTCTAPGDAVRMLDVLDLTYTQPVRLLHHGAELRLPSDPDDLPVTVLTGRAQAVGGTITRLPFVTPLGEGGTTLHMSGSGGARVGREFRDHGRGIMVGELVLPRPYRDQERFEVVGTLTGQPATAGEHHFEWGLPAAADEFVLRVRFPGRVPQHVQHYTRVSPSPSAPREVVGEVPVRAETAQVTITDAAAGIHGLQWRW